MNFYDFLSLQFVRRSNVLPDAKRANNSTLLNCPKFIIQIHLNTDRHFLLLRLMTHENFVAQLSCASKVARMHVCHTLLQSLAATCARKFCNSLQLVAVI